MSEDLKRDLIAYRLEQAQNALQEAKVLKSNGLLPGAVNRGYYSMFYSIQALLVHSGLKSSRHSGAISLFDREFVRTHLFDKDFSKWVHELFQFRQDADYSDLFVVKEERVQQAIERAESFMLKVKEYLEELPS